MTTAGVKIEKSEVKNQIIGRIAGAGFLPNDPRTKQTLFKIGVLVSNLAKANLTNQGIVSSGQLRAKTTFLLEGNQDVQRVLIGPFGVKYARMVELGGAFTRQQQKAMFASFRERGLKKKEGKGVIKGGRYRARPYLAPALRDSRKQINEMVRSIILKKD